MELFKNVRPAAPHEFNSVGKLMVSVYQQLDGFPKPVEQPAYYEMLANVGALTSKPGTEIFVAIENDIITGAVVYFDDMQYYGSGGTATREKLAAGFRLLAVDPRQRGKGIGKLLTCIVLKRHAIKAIANSSSTRPGLCFQPGRCTRHLDFKDQLILISNRASWRYLVFG